MRICDICGKKDVAPVWEKGIRCYPGRRVNESLWIMGVDSCGECEDKFLQIRSEEKREADIQYETKVMTRVGKLKDDFVRKEEILKNVDRKGTD